MSAVQAEFRIRRMWQHGGVIMRERGANVLAVHKRGDRRTRRLCWIETLEATEWLDLGVLVQTDKGYELSPDVTDRLSCGHSPRQVMEALAERAKRARRAQARTPQVATFDTLTDRKGVRVFTDTQVRAARQFARDLSRAGQGGKAVATSDYAAPQVDGTRRHDSAEDAMLRRIDAGRAVARAKQGMDARVLRTLTRVIGADETFAELEAAQGWGAGVGPMLMQIGLDHLARHYGVR